MEVNLDVVNFKQEMFRIRKEVDRLGEINTQKRMLYATEQLRRVTPVDTGEARSGWSTKFSKSLNGEIGIIENPVEHVVYLNRGHSKQAPAYFIEQVLSMIGIITP